MNSMIWLTLYDLETGEFIPGAQIAVSRAELVPLQGQGSPERGVMLGEWDATLHIVIGGRVCDRSTGLPVE